MRLPGARVVAFEENEASQDSLREMASANGVANRIQVFGRCGPGDLSPVVSPGAFVLCDVEGYEGVMLDPDAEPALRDCEILVEIHDFAIPRVGDLVRGRFEPTHEIDVVWQEDRQLSDFPNPAWFQKIVPEDYSTAFLQELRPTRMYWLHMRPRA
jgi:hypothetical protein